MKTLFMAVALMAVAGLAMNAGAETSTTNPAATTATKPAVPSTTPATAATPTAPSATTVATGTTPTTTTPTTTTTAAKPTTTTTPTTATTPTTTTPTTATAEFTGQITGLNPTTCKIKDATGSEKTFNLAGTKTEGWKVGDKVTAKYDPKTWNLVSVTKAQ